MGMSDSFCLICNTSLDVSACMNIFYTTLPRNGDQLVNLVLHVLRSAVSDLRSSYMCSACYNLFQMLEQAQWTVANIKCEILKVYRNSEKRKAVEGIVQEEVDVNFQRNIEFESLCAQQTRPGVETVIYQLRESQEDAIANGVKKSEQKEPVKDKLGNHSLSVFGNNADEGMEDVNVKILLGDVDNSKKLGEAKLLDRSDTYVGNYSDHPAKTEVPYSPAVLNSSDNICTNSILDQEAFPTEQCKFCNELFKTVEELNAHLSKHNALQHYQCEKCKEPFNNKISPSNANSTKPQEGEHDCTSIRPHSCKNIILDFPKPDTAYPESKLQAQGTDQLHEFIWKEINDASTEVKENSENTGEAEVNRAQISWRSGRISKYSQKPLKYACPTCDKKWRTSAELKTHVKTHSTLRPYMCEKCGQAYKHKHALEVHVGMHNGINPFQCNFCKKCFTQKGALMRHLPMHTGETPYQCELCGKRFVHHTSYNMHALSHTGKKSYRCHICDLSLLSTSHLKRHMRVHTGEKPYSCTLCGKRFAERYNLFAHQKIHDPSEIIAKEAKRVQHKCNECNLAFDKKQKLDDHVKGHTIDKTSEESKKTRRLYLEVDSKNDSGPKVCSFGSEGYDQGSKTSNIEDSGFEQTWVQMNRSKLPNVDNQTRFLLLQNPSGDVDENSFAVTFDEHKISLENTNYNASLQVIIEASSSSADKIHI
ncbi:hypothetical protein KM043_001091 [Ampulex compressa]|nr:hypothetical protein KM043_001091 [Ampulex compressa]